MSVCVFANLSPFDPLQSAFYSHLVFWPSRQVLLLYTYKSNSAFGGPYRVQGYATYTYKQINECVSVCVSGRGKGKRNESPTNETEPSR